MSSWSLSGAVLDAMRDPYRGALGPAGSGLFPHNSPHARAWLVIVSSARLTGRATMAVDRTQGLRPTRRRMFAVVSRAVSLAPATTFPIGCLSNRSPQTGVETHRLVQSSHQASRPRLSNADRHQVPRRKLALWVPCSYRVAIRSEVG